MDGLPLNIVLIKYCPGIYWYQGVIQFVVLKVFMRDSQKYALQSKLQDEVLSRIIMIQRWVRAKLIRCRYLQVVSSVMTIQVMSLYLSQYV